MDPRSIDRHHKLIDLNYKGAAAPIIKYITENEPEVNFNDIKNILDSFLVAENDDDNYKNMKKRVQANKHQG